MSKIPVQYAKTGAIPVQYAKTGTIVAPVGSNKKVVDLSLRLQNIQSAQFLEYIKGDRVSIVTVDGMLVQYDILCDDTTLMQRFSFVSQPDRDNFLVVLLRSISVSQSITTFRISGVKDLFNIRDVSDLLGNIVMSHDNISTIILQNNAITQAQFKRLFTYLCVRISEISIDLQFNPIDHTGPSIIADLMTQHSIILSGVKDLEIGAFKIVSPKVRFTEDDMVVDGELAKVAAQVAENNRLVDEELAKVAEDDRLVDEELALVGEEFAAKALGYSEDFA